MIAAWLAGCEREVPTVVVPVDTSTPTVTTPEPSEPPPTVRSVDVTPHTLENARQVDVSLSAPSAAALLCVDRADPDERVLLESPSATEHAFRLQGLRFGATYDCAAAPVPSVRSVWPFEVAVGAPPVWTPPITVVSAPSRPLPDGWVLTAVQGLGGCGAVLHLAIFDSAGGLRWHFPVVGSQVGVEVLHVGGGVLVYGGTTNQPGPVAVDLWSGVSWASDLPENRYLHHDAKQLIDGRVLTLEQRPNTLGEDSWNGFGVRTFDPQTGLVDFEYDSQQAVDAGALPVGVGDAWHANWVDLLDAGDGPILYVSLCFTSQILAIDATTQTVRWIFGAGGDFRLVDPAGAPLDDGEFTQCQHGLEVSADGTGILAYDNGRERDESRVVAYTLDAAAGVATRDWTWTDSWHEGTLGDVDWLPNGNVLVTEGHGDCWSNGDRSEIVEFDPATGETGWRLSFDDPADAIYRAQRLDGCEVFANVGRCVALEPRWAELAPSLGF